MQRGTIALLAVSQKLIEGAMAYTVWGAFDKFREIVDLDATVTQQARTSRNYLFDQIKSLAQNNSDFPKLSGGYLAFGSFARKTKICPLDDIDILILLNGRGTTSQQSYSEPLKYFLKVTDYYCPLASFVDDYGHVNSTRVLNKVKSHLASVSNYQKAEITKRMQAVTLNLKSYTWVFDIVPAVPVSDYYGNTIHYLIPDGVGKWIQTDPRIDSKNIMEVNTRHNGNFLPTIRLLKSWNGRTHKPRLSSYYFETLAIKVFQSASVISSFSRAVQYFFDNCGTYLLNPCPDPKGLGDNLDAGFDLFTKHKVNAAIQEASTFASYAMMYEAQGNQEKAIYWWGRIFGTEFPIYGA
jgi:hypothetical protein